MSEALFAETLDRLAADGQEVRFWLRDDDAVVPSSALDRLLRLAADNAVPVTLAVIPRDTGAPLADALKGREDVYVAVHGWSHANHAGANEKKQELGAHRPLSETTAQLAAGFDKLASLYPHQFIPMLVPPWNRIAPEVIDALPDLGFRSLSVFGPEQAAAVPCLNTHVDIMNWHGVRGGRDPAGVFAELAKLVESPKRPKTVGILTHHLVHDDSAWRFLEALFQAKTRHPGCRWVSSQDALRD